MQHYALFLQGFNYDIKYKKSELHANADCLSRLPIPSTDFYNCDTIDEFQNTTFNTLHTYQLQQNKLHRLHYKTMNCENYINSLRQGNDFSKVTNFIQFQLQSLRYLIM